MARAVFPPKKVPNCYAGARSTCTAWIETSFWWTARWPDPLNRFSRGVVIKTSLDQNTPSHSCRIHQSN